mmetsp:Transcript_17532/g.21203  ORF Transcript_17532/g.21203 Transcript_17532/m.21203 type:complete len:115 (-) Transcript_17532:771-1115(-)
MTTYFFLIIWDRTFELLHTSGQQMAKHHITSSSNPHSRLSIFPLFCEKRGHLRVFLANNGYIGEKVPYVETGVSLHTRDRNPCLNSGTTMPIYVKNDFVFLFYSSLIDCLLIAI